MIKLIEESLLQVIRLQDFNKRRFPEECLPETIMLKTLNDMLENVHNQLISERNDLIRVCAAMNEISTRTTVSDTFALNDIVRLLESLSDE